jgi:RHS repeat-associated protein
MNTNSEALGVRSWWLGCLLSLGAAVTSLADSTSVRVNRTVPQVEPPRPVLQFSSQPAKEEFFRAHVFQEPLVPVGGEPSTAENADLAAALRGYAHRNGPDDFASLTQFLEKHPDTPWRTALLTDLGLEYYNTAHYSLALDAWSQAWVAGKEARDAKGKAITDRAVGELAFMYARLGRMRELEALLKSVEGRGFIGPAAGRISGAREGLWSMQNRPEISFRCGPLALKCIKLALNPQSALNAEVLNSASTQTGFSLTQVAELSKKIGLNYQMARREVNELAKSESVSSKLTQSQTRSFADFVVPCVVHWRVGHYAAMVRKEGKLYLLRDPTFGNETWATREALEAETSGYFLIPPGPLPPGWRGVDEKEGGTVWGKGQTTGNDDRNITKRDLKTSGPVCRGMTVPSIHLMTANLNLADEPVGYTPPVGPPVRLTVRYNHRESFQPGNFTYSNFGHGWTCDWISFITDNPSSLLADVTLYAPGGGERAFTGFDPGTQTFAPQQYDQTILKRTGAASYELASADGSKLVFSQSDGAIGSSRDIFLTRILDPAGNAVTLTYDSNLRIVALTDAIGQVTTLSYGLDDDIYKVTKVTDPFGRFATLGYEQVTTEWSYTNHNDCPIPFVQATPIQDVWLQSITDVIGLTSQYSYLVVTNARFSCAVCPTNGTQRCVTNDISVNFIDTLITPYGTNSFTVQDSGNNRALEINYPDGSRERVEYTQTVNVPPEPAASVPVGMSTQNANLLFRNTFYWSRTACALGYRDYSKARLYHWLHTESLSTTSDGLESMKEPLEGRVWFDYLGQSAPIVIGPTTRPTHIGRVLDDGSTQLYTTAYDSFGHVTNSIDPVGRQFRFVYDTNETDLLEIRQTRGVNNELLFAASYNPQHRPVNVTNASGQTTTLTYNSRGQVLTWTDAKNETTRYTYDSNGYLVAADGPLPGGNDLTVATYDSFGRVRTLTDVNGYTLTFDHDDMDRLTRVTHPDATFSQYTYDRLDCVAIRDRAGRQSLFEFDRMRQLTKHTDRLGRTTSFEWCTCGDLKSLTDPMGRMTTWTRDAQGRIISKQFGDGSQIQFVYEDKARRVRQVIDEKQQIVFYTYNRDNTPRSVAYGNAGVPTPTVSYLYDPNYNRMVSMTDGIGITTYSYNPITDTPTLGAGALASVDGPLPSETITYTYDELGRPTQTSINGVGMATEFDAAGRTVTSSNVLGSFSYRYDGSSRRILAEGFPNGETMECVYGDNSQDRSLQQISYAVGPLAVSRFSYGRDLTRGRITSWSQQVAGQSPAVSSFMYDAGDQLLSAAVTNGGALVNTYGYAYDLAGNRMTEQVGASIHNASYNALNEVSTTTAPSLSRTNEWDAAHRLTAVNVGNERTEFSYDGASRLAGIRKLVNGSEVSRRRFVWCGAAICEERDASGTNVTKRFYPQGVKVETGASAGAYYYARDHLSSIRALTDSSGAIRASYTYDPFGRATKTGGDVDADFGFAGMFWSNEAGLALTRFRVYDAELGRWLSRDPLVGAELKEGPNLYAYVGNEPVNRVDPSGLCTGTSLCACVATPQNAAACVSAGILTEQTVQPALPQAIQTAENLAPEALECAEGVAAVARSPVMQQTIFTPGDHATLPNFLEKVVDVAESGPGLNTQVANAVRDFGPTRIADTIIAGASEADAELTDFAEENAEWADKFLEASFRNRPVADPWEWPERVLDTERILDRATEIRGYELP